MLTFSLLSCKNDCTPVIVCCAKITNNYSICKKFRHNIVLFLTKRAILFAKTEAIQEYRKALDDHDQSQITLARVMP